MDGYCNWHIEPLTSIGILFVLVGVFAAILFIGIRFKKINEYNVIQIRQRFLTAVSTIIVFAVFPVSVGAVVYFALYMVFKMIVFKKDASRRQELYAKYEAHKKPYPLIQRFSKEFYLPCTKIDDAALDRDFYYSFPTYLDNAVLLPLMCLFGATAVCSASTLIYAIEFFIVATAIYVLIGKLVYWLAVTNPASLFFLSPRLAYIPIIVIGIVFYLLTAVIFISTL